MRPAEPATCGLGGPIDAGAFFTHRAVMASDPVADALALPASRGVVVMVGDAERPVFMAATGDCRALSRRKLAPAERGVRAGADLRSIVREVRAVECGSAFDSDLVYLLLARRLMPHAAKLVADRWRSWWAQIEPDAAFPEWSKTDLAIGAVATRSASTAKGFIRDASDGGSIVGPFADKDSAGRFTERMTDAFDLCREHRLLVLAPHAQACAYKEMGRCAAPCDGSESMDSYRARVRAAVDAAAGDGMEACAQREEAAMRAAAASHDFELAAKHKAQAERLAKLAGPAASRIGKLEDFRFLLVCRSVKDHWARLLCCDRGHVRWLADINPAGSASKPAGDLVELCRSACAWADGSSHHAMSREEVDVLGLLARERVVPDTRRTAWFVPLHRRHEPEVSARAVMRAAAAAFKPRKAAQADAAAETDARSDGPVHELEAMPEHLSDEGADA